LLGSFSIRDGTSEWDTLAQAIGAFSFLIDAADAAGAHDSIPSAQSGRGCRIATNTAIDHLNRRGANAKMHVPLTKIVASQKASTENVRGAVVHEVQRLSPKLRIVVNVWTNRASWSSVQARANAGIFMNALNFTYELDNAQDDDQR
jgi:hypothetical protein